MSEGTEKCPLTGQQGSACPFGFGSGDKRQSGPSEAELDTLRSESCPFPFIFLHDPANGWKLYRKKVVDLGVWAAVVAGVLAVIAAFVLVDDKDDVF